MAMLTLYYPTTEERDESKNALAELAAEHGYYTVHESKRRGNIRMLLDALIDGELAIILLGDEQRMAAIDELLRLSEDESVNWIARGAFADIAEALKDARRRDEAY